MTQAKGWSLPATGKQLSAIARLARLANIKEPIEDRPMTRGEAGQQIVKLRRMLQTKETR